MTKNNETQQQNLTILTPDQKQQLLTLMFGGVDPGSDFYLRLFSESLAVHLDPILAFDNVCRCAEWISKNNPKNQ